MSRRFVPIPAGTIFTITEGEYSDYSIHGIFRALREIRAVDWDPPEEYSEQLISRMIREGIIEYLGRHEICLSFGGSPVWQRAIRPEATAFEDDDCPLSWWKENKDVDSAQ